MGANKTIEQRLADKYVINAVTGCWDWIGAKNPNGYGKIGHEGKTISAHKASYEIRVGKVPAGLELRHRCNNRGCINTEHLTPGTSSENNQDCVLAGNNKLVKLTPEDVHAIRELLNEGLSEKEIAMRFAVRQPLINRIRHGKRWGYLAAKAV